jgi:hypothetical protein
VTSVRILREIRRAAVFLEHPAKSRDKTMQADSAGDIRAVSEQRGQLTEKFASPGLHSPG